MGVQHRIRQNAGNGNARFNRRGYRTFRQHDARAAKTVTMNGSSWRAAVSNVTLRQSTDRNFRTRIRPVTAAKTMQGSAHKECNSAKNREQSEDGPFFVHKSDS